MEWEGVLKEENEMLIIELFKNKYFKYIHPLDFSINRKNIHPLLAHPESPLDMVKMKANIKFLINEVPVAELLKIKEIEKDDTCTLCTLNRKQTISHVIAECPYILADKNIEQLWNIHESK